MQLVLGEDADPRAPPLRGKGSNPLGHDEGGHLYDADELEAIRAVEAYRGELGKPFLTLTEILFVLKRLGYRKGGAGGEGENQN